MGTTHTYVFEKPHLFVFIILNQRKIICGLNLSMESIHYEKFKYNFKMVLTPSHKGTTTIDCLVTIDLRISI